MKEGKVLKIKKIMSFILISCLIFSVCCVLTGCSFGKAEPKTAIEIRNRVNEEIKQLKSVHIDMSANISGDAKYEEQKEKISMIMNMKTNIIFSPKASYHLIGTAEIKGLGTVQNTPYEIFSEYNGLQYVSYFSPDNKSWTKTSSINKPEMLEISRLIISAEDDIEKNEAETTDETIVLDATTAYGDISSLSSALGVSMLESSSSKSRKKDLKIPVKLYVDKKTYLPKQINITFDSTKSTPDSASDSNLFFNKIDIQMKFSLFDGVKQIAIPEDVLENAVPAGQSKGNGEEEDVEKGTVSSSDPQTTEPIKEAETTEPETDLEDETENQDFNGAVEKKVILEKNN